MPWPLHGLLRHKDVKITRDNTHVLNRGRRGAQSPLDRCFQKCLLMLVSPLWE